MPSTVRSDSPWSPATRASIAEVLDDRRCAQRRRQGASDKAADSRSERAADATKRRERIARTTKDFVRAARLGKKTDHGLDASR
jgi:hypothetical protein